MSLPSCYLTLLMRIATFFVTLMERLAPRPPRPSQDAYVHVTKIKKWDICAGDAILRALGGRLTDLDGREVDYRDEGQKGEPEVA